MDLIKIGKYIASKRKAIGLTQKELGEKLGKSDKSVSKWERGICLPDVSVYLQLCEILGITVNEFLAGEDIEQQDIIQKTDETLLEVTKDHHNNMSRLKQLFIIFVSVAVIIIAVLSSILYNEHTQPTNYIKALNPDSTEVKAVRMIGGSSTSVFECELSEDFKTVGVLLKEYHYGELTNQHFLFGMIYDGVYENFTNGTIVIMPDLNHSLIHTVVEFGGANSKRDIDILSDADSSETMGSLTTYSEEMKNLVSEEETIFFAMVCDPNGIRAISIDDILTTPDVLNDFQYTYLFSIFPDIDENDLKS